MFVWYVLFLFKKTVEENGNAIFGVSGMMSLFLLVCQCDEFDDDLTSRNTGMMVSGNYHQMALCQVVELSWFIQIWSRLITIDRLVDLQLSLAYKLMFL